MSSRDSLASGKFTKPTTQELRDLMQKHGLQGKDLRLLVDSTHDQVRRWLSLSQPDNPKYQIPYACWRTLLFELGEIVKE